MIKLALSKNHKIKISKTLWKYIGYKAGWKQTVLDKISSKNNGLIKIAQVSREEVGQAVMNSISLSGYNKGYMLRERGTEVIMDETAAKQRIFEAFMQIYARDRSFNSQIEAYVSNKRPFSLGVFSSVESGKKYLVPSFSGVGLPQLKSIFSGSINAIIDIPRGSIEVAIGEQRLSGVTGIEDIIKMFNRAGFIVKNGVVEIGSIGSRSTNWDTSYNMSISGANVVDLIEALTKFTDITNKDISNIQANTNNYNLTMAREVRDLMAGLGLGEIYENTVRAIKKFEVDNNLKSIHNRFHKIPNYTERTKIDIIELSKYEEQVFHSLFENVMNNYAQIVANSGVGDSQELFSVAYSMGTEGDLINDQSVRELLSAAA